MRGQSGLDDVASLLGIRVGTVGMAVSMSCRITLLWGPFEVRGALLLARRRGEKSWYPSCWDFPGGHLEPGEHAADALVRELWEEVGVVAVVGEPPGW